MGRQVIPLDSQPGFLKQQREDADWWNAVEESVKTTEFCHDFIKIEDALKQTDARIKDVAIVSMTSWDCAKALQWLKDTGLEPEDTKIIIHNFADVKYPGGFFMKRRGGAQEESLCSASGLYPILAAYRDAYGDCYSAVAPIQHKYLNSRFAPVIYSKDVPTSRRLGSIYKPFKCDYVSSAMMTLRHAERAADYEVQLERRVSTTFSDVLLHAGDKRTYFITGAWGCGAFRNDPKEVFGEYKKVIDSAQSDTGNITVVLAIPGGNNLDAARLAFNRIN